MSMTQIGIYVIATSVWTCPPGECSSAAAEAERLSPETMCSFPVHAESLSPP